MKQKFVDILEQCIRLMITGVPLENCLEKFPDHASELNQLLKTAELMNSLQVEKIPLDAKAQNQMKLLALAESLSSGSKRGKNIFSIYWLDLPVRKVLQSMDFLRPLAGRLILALGIAGIFIIFSGSLLITSAKSLPGDSLYPVKRVVEDIKVYLAPSREVRNEYEHVYSEERVDEVFELMGLAREQKISFEGIISSMDGSNWTVNDIPVFIQPDTMIIVGIDGANVMVPGMYVEVDGNTSIQGRVYANEIHLREYQIIGIVEEISAETLKIWGIPINISPYTQIDPGIKVGDEATVLIRSEDDLLEALAILLEMHPELTIKTDYSSENTATQLKYSQTDYGDEQSLFGTLEIVSPDYWVVSGQKFYIISDTEISEEISIGDVIYVKYIIEPNGSFTAVEIEVGDDGGISREIDQQETLEHLEDQDDHDSSEDTESDGGVTDESEDHGEPEEAADPTDNQP